MRNFVGLMVGCAIVASAGTAQAASTGENVKTYATDVASYQVRKTPTKYFNAKLRLVGATKLSVYNFANKVYQRYCSVPRTEEQVSGMTSLLMKGFYSDLDRETEDFELQTDARSLIYYSAGKVNCAPAKKPVLFNPEPSAPTP
jgi:hypothetical protein